MELPVYLAATYEVERIPVEVSISIFGKVLHSVRVWAGSDAGSDFPRIDEELLVSEELELFR
tara:strand:- start:59643 stop:59828 length:186 start_codon:yes stop_codon:yes gene_type:complete